VDHKPCLGGCRKYLPCRDSIPGPCNPYRVAIPTDLSWPLTCRQTTAICHNIKFLKNPYSGSLTFSCGRGTATMKIIYDTYSLPFSVANTQKIHTRCVSIHNSLRKPKIAFRGYFLPRAVKKMKGYYTRTPAHARTHTRARARTHTHTHITVKD